MIFDNVDGFFNYNVDLNMEIIEECMCFFLIYIIYIR